MALSMNDLNFNEDLSAGELTTVKGGGNFAHTFTGAFGRDGNSSAGANADSRPGRGFAEAFGDVETKPGGWGVAVGFAVSVVTPDPEDLRARFLR